MKSGKPRLDKVKLIDVRTPEEYAFVGHPDTAWNIPLAFVTYQRKNGKTEYGPKWNADFVAEVKEYAGLNDTLLVMCQSSDSRRQGSQRACGSRF